MNLSKSNFVCSNQIFLGIDSYISNMFLELIDTSLKSYLLSFLSSWLTKTIIFKEKKNIAL
jgi:hypothetical protein